MSACVLIASSATSAAAAPASTPAAAARASSTTLQPASSQAADPSLTHGPVGWDTYRHLDQLPILPAGVQTQQFASTDPAGQNGDFNHTLGQAPDGSSILARYQGAGEIDAIWTTSNGGDVTQTGNIKITLDGQVVLDAPEQDVVNGKLGAPFTFPLVANADQSSGGDYIEVPMPFRSSMLITTTSDPVYYHVDYRKIDDPIGVSTFNRQQDPAQDVVSELAAAGTTDPKGTQQGQSTTQAAITATPGQTDTLDSFPGPARINALQLTLPQLSQLSQLSPQAVGTAPTASTATPGPADLGISPSNNGVRVSRRLQAGAGDAGADILVGGTKVASFPPTAPGTASSAHWAAQTVTLPTSATAGQSSIHVVPSSPGSIFAYQAKLLPSPAVASAISATDDVLQNVRLRITFDGQQTVDAPLGQFFGSGLGEATVNALMVAVNPQTNTLSAWWPMPYAQNATVRLFNGSQQSLAGTAQITTAPASGEAQALGPSGQDGYFHATANAQNPTVSGQNYSFLSTASWGKFVGVSQTLGWLVMGPLGTCILEGNEQAYVDGSPTAQVNGTGTEDFYHGGWYFNRGAFSRPLNGAPTDDDSGNCQMNISAYRLMLADAIPFGSSNKFGIQHGPLNTTPANYSSTAYWYGRSGASPVLYHALPLQNGWTQASGANAPAYVLEGNYVRLLGGVKGGFLGQPLAILPRSLAPSTDEWFPVVTANNAVAPLLIKPDGTLTLHAGNAAFVSLSGIVLDVGSSTAYQSLGLQNAWSPAPGTSPPGSSPGYVQNGDYVELTGSLRGGGINQVVATLPSNLVPAADEWFPVVTANDVVAPLVVHANGTIVLNGGDPGFLSLAGIGVMVGPPPASNLTLQNGWSQAPGTDPPGFTQRGREVDLRGGIRGGQVGQTIATLPSAARPANDESLPAVTANQVVGRVVAHPDGSIVLSSGNTAFLSLESLRISAGVVSPVASAPGAPTIGRATAGNAQASVTFAPPADDGGSPVTSYTATANDLTAPAHGGQTASGSASPITVRGLTNGDAYTISVTATNSVGTGPPSNPSNPVTPGGSSAEPAEPVVASPQFGVANRTDLFSVGADGSVQLRWVQGSGRWNGPLAISQGGLAPVGAHLAVSPQFGVPNQTDVFVVGNNGATWVLWVQGAGNWNGPMAITPANTAPAGAGLAASNQFGIANQTDVFVVGNDGAARVSWVDGAGSWNGPTSI